MRVTPEQLRREADEAETLSRVVSYARDKAWLGDKAAELRRQADLLEQGAWPPEGRKASRPRPEAG